MTHLIAAATLAMASPSVVDVGPAASLLALAGQATAADIVQRNFRDASMQARIVQTDFRELREISSDFGNQYRFRSIRIWVAEPMRLRLEAQVEDTNVTYILNGFRQSARIPRLGINSRQDLSRSPGRLQTVFDFGILTPSLLENLFDAEFVRNDRATGNLVFDIRYKPELNDSSRHRIWVDPERRIVTRREWYGQGSRPRLRAIFLYQNPVLAGGIWLPTRVEVRSANNRVAGITEYIDYRVNQGIPEERFRL
ncbi:MAG: hypothetical protein SNJ74_00020 [Fimbriimonadaceae bacterium]